MTDKIIDLSTRFNKRKAIHEQVEAYELSPATLRGLKVRRSLRPLQNHGVQADLIHSGYYEGYSWQDAVFFMVVVQLIRKDQLSPAILDGLDADEQYFVHCCEQRRLAL